jgi:hypothetical protein
MWMALAADAGADPAIGAEVQLCVRQLEGESILMFTAVEDSDVAGSPDGYTPGRAKKEL